MPTTGPTAGRTSGPDHTARAGRTPYGRPGRAAARPTRTAGPGGRPPGRPVRPALRRRPPRRTPPRITPPRPAHYPAVIFTVHAPEAVRDSASTRTPSAGTVKLSPRPTGASARGG